MVAEFDFITAKDKPALLAVTNPEWLEAARSALNEMGYKVHVANNHDEFRTNFNQIQFQMVVLEELFAANIPEENRSLLALQSMPMAQRRHAVVVLVGDSYVTFNLMQALQLSAHAVLNRSEMFLLIQLLQKIVADNDLFYSAYRSAQNRIHDTGE